MRRLLLIALPIICCTLSAPTRAEEAYLYGQVTNVTTGPAGLLILLSTGVPGNCSGVGYGWMTIPEANKTMIAAALIVWQNQGFATVYTNPLSGGVCTINQFDPQ
jgi:hypothetical protein